METLIPTQMSVSQLVEMFQRGKIAIPEIQRDVVWKAEQVKDLIDSISQSYPCGSLILWEPREKDKSLVRSMIRPERLEQSRQLPTYFLLDGQQRITALASVMLPREELKSLLLELEEEMPFIFVNLKKFPKDIEATTDVGGYKLPWVPFHRLFDASFALEQAQLVITDRKAVQKYVQGFRDYSFPVQIIGERTYEAVADIFTRVNSQGTQLTGAEIHLARIVPHWKGITKEFRIYRQSLRVRNYDLDLTFLLRAITVVECQVPRLKRLAERVAKDRPSRRQLDKSWRRAKTAIEDLIRLLQKELLLDKSKFFASKNALVPLIYVLANVNGKRISTRDMKRFFVLSQLSERYSAAAETALNRDFRTLNEHVSARDGLSALAASSDKDARQFIRGLKVKPDHIHGVASKNVMLLLMYIVMRRRDANDWGPGKTAALSEIPPKDLQLHHIFPFNFMTANKEAETKFTANGRPPIEYRRAINDIANLTFLSRAKNVAIGDDPPAEYLALETTREMRKAHFVPDDAGLWKPGRFEDFLAERRRLLAAAMTQLLKF